MGGGDNHDNHHSTPSTMTHTTTNNNLELHFWVVNRDPQFQDLCVPWQSPSLPLSLSLLQQGLGGLFSLALRARPWKSRSV